MYEVGDRLLASQEGLYSNEFLGKQDVYTYSHLVIVTYCT
jgi:hypothetical protein